MLIVCNTKGHITCHWDWMNVYYIFWTGSLLCVGSDGPFLTLCGSTAFFPFWHRMPFGQFHMRNGSTANLKNKQILVNFYFYLDRLLNFKVIWWRLKWNINMELLCCRIQRNYMYSQLKNLAKFSGNSVKTNMPRWSLNKRELWQILWFKWWHWYLCTI